MVGILLFAGVSLLTICLVAASRCLLVLLFLPFSALDKVINFSQAVGQASQAIHNSTLARVAIGAGFFVEVIMSVGVILGVADRAAALVLAGYCAVTAILWKQFWKSSDFNLQGVSHGRDTFWDFLKNLALAGGFLMVTCGGTAMGLTEFLRHPLASSHPYRLVAPGTESTPAQSF